MAFPLKFARFLLWQIFDVTPWDQKWVMGRTFVSCPWAINGDLLLFLPFYFWLFSWSIFWNICSEPSIVTSLKLVNVEILWEKFYHWLVNLHMEPVKMFPFSWLILAFFHVKCHQPCSCWNLMFRMLVDYWYDPILGGSWMKLFLVRFINIWFLAPCFQCFIENSGFMYVVLSEAKKLTVIDCFVAFY